MTEAVDILLFIGIALIAARIFGELFERIKLSAILGELLAGIIIGGPLFLLVGMSEEKVEIFMNRETLEFFSQIGILFLLFIVGMDINFRELRKIGKQSAIISFTEVIIALVGGFLTGFFLITKDWKFALFFGTLFTATSIGVTVRTLANLGKLGSREGQTLLSVAVFDDFIALILVLVFSGALFSQDDGKWFLNLLLQIGILVIFIIFIMLILPKILRFLEYQFNVFSGAHTASFSLGIIFGILVIIAYFAEQLQFSGAIMAFLLGLSIQQNKLIVGEIKDTVVKFGEGVFIPLFFFSVGSNFELSAKIFTPLNFLIIALGILSKATGAIVGSKLSGLSLNSASKIAVGITPRAEIILVIAGIGFANRDKIPAFDSTIFSIAILFVFISVLITPFALRFAFRDKKEKTEKIAEESTIG